MSDHVVDELPKCRCIVQIGQTGIYNKLFSDDYVVRDVIDAMMEDARGTLQYKRHRRNRGAAIRHAEQFIVFILRALFPIIFYFVLWILSLLYTMNLLTYIYHSSIS